MRLFVDNNYQDCDPGNSSSAESSDGNNSCRLTTNNPKTMSSPRIIRGTSEPPVDYHARTGLRQSGCPFKVSGIVMGSQKNLAASSDDEKSSSNDPYSIFGRRLRRSITPVRISTRSDVQNSTLPRSNNFEKQTNLNAVGYDGNVAFSTPFGTTQNSKGVGKHPFKGQRKSDVGQWGTPRYVQNSTSHTDTNTSEETQIFSKSMESSRIEKELIQTSNDIKSFVESCNRDHEARSSTTNVEKTIFLVNKESKTRDVNQNTMNETNQTKSTVQVTL